MGAAAADRTFATESCASEGVDAGGSAHTMIRGRPRLIALSLAGCIIACGADANFEVDLHIVGKGIVSIGEVTCEADCRLRARKGSSLSAIPSPGWSFESWEGLCEGSEQTCALGAAGSVTARFREIPPLSIEVIGLGKVVLSSSESCESNCSYAGRTVETSLTAIPAAGWHFVAYEGACTGNACSVVTGHVVARFEKNATLSIVVSGTGSGRVRDSLGRFECRANCQVDEPGPLTILVDRDPGTTSVQLSGACTSAPCETRAPATLRVEFVRGRTVGLRVDGAGRVSGGGLDCPPSCSIEVDPSESLSVKAESERAFVDFSGWDGGCGRIDGGECFIPPSTSDVEIVARFESPLRILKTIHVLPSVSNLGGIRALRLAGSSPLAAWYAESGIEFEGQIIAPPSGTFHSSGVVLVGADGGTQWVRSVGTHLDGGTLQVAHVNFRYLRSTEMAVIAGGVCVSAPSLCTANRNFIAELSPSNGQLRFIGTLGTPPSVPNATFADLGSLALTAEGPFLYDFGLGASAATVQTLPTNLAACEPGNLSPLCLMSWTTSGAWQGCLLTQPIGAAGIARDAALIRWNPQIGTCSLVASFSSLGLSQQSTITVGGGLVALMGQDARLDPTTTLAGRFTAVGELRDGGFNWLTENAAATVDSAFVDSKGISLAFTAVFLPITRFGVTIPPFSSALISFGPGPSVRRAVVFEHTLDLVGHSAMGLTALGVNGTDVTVGGKPLEPDAGRSAQLLVFPD